MESGRAIYCKDIFLKKAALFTERQVNLMCLHLPLRDKLRRSEQVARHFEGESSRLPYALVAVVT